MEQRQLFSTGRPERELTRGEVERRIGAITPGWRSSSDAGLPVDAPRGDHDLNPDFYRPGQPMTAAAVLVPLVERRRGLTVLLTRRTDHLNDHAGQISFPGGRVESHDDGPIAAALRETEEEIGLNRRKVQPIGQLDLYVTRTGFEVTPVVGVVDAPFRLRLDSFEVAEAFEVPLSFFLDPDNRRTHSRVYQGKLRHFYVYPYQDYFIWGATAGMLNNLSEVLG